ncbi:hypothetical protein [Moorella sulfitireducens (nom. illeg.)]|uniref:hypothetical protein n=1 Tax=Neomoorella sulfitireducens TaxID=2972948 RepID=UPI0021AC830C|nr:hypothetical protein [Moorella sulfitireducens]
MVTLGILPPIGLLGLVSDIVGAYYLASSFIRKRPEEIIQEAGSYWGYNPSLLNSMVEQQVEAWLGFTLLSIGFLGQSATYATGGLQNVLNASQFLCSGLIGIFLFLVTNIVKHPLLKWRLRVVGIKLVREEINDYLKRKPEDKSYLLNNISRYLEFLQLKRLQGETDEEALDRVIKICLHK